MNNPQFVAQGDTISCKYTEDCVEYMFSGLVTKIKKAFPDSITIDVEKVDKFENKL